MKVGVSVCCLVSLSISWHDKDHVSMICEDLATSPNPGSMIRMYL